MISASTLCFVVQELILNEKQDCYTVKCGTSIGYNKDEKKSKNAYFTAKIKEQRFFNMVKTLKKGAKIFLAGDFKYGIFEQDDKKIYWVGLDVKIFEYSSNYQNTDNEEKSAKVESSQENSANEKNTLEKSTSNKNHSKSSNKTKNENQIKNSKKNELEDNGYDEDDDLPF